MSLQDTLSRISDAMNAQVMEWREKGAIRFEDVPEGARFLWAALPADSPDTHPKIRTKSGYRVSEKSPVFRTGRRVLCYVHNILH